MTRVDTVKANVSQLKSDLRKAGATLALIRSLRGFFREQVTVERAEGEIRRSLETREERFLELIQTRVYARPSSAYLKLLNFAGCDYSDLRASVRRHGLEGALEQLAKAGVYLTAEEFKGKREVVRGTLSFSVSPGEFDLQDSVSGFVTESSGSSNRPVRTLNPIDWIAIRTFSIGVYLKAHDLFSRSHAVYDAILPGTGGILFLLSLAKLGIGADRWFARKIPVNSRLASCHHYLTTYLIVMAGKMFGPGFPRPEFIDLEEMGRILRWVEGQRRAGKACAIRTVASNAARIARAARQAGMSLDGTKFIVSGEPFTKTKAEIIRQTGATTALLYGYSGPHMAGFGCANPAYTDDMHVGQNMLAAIAHPAPISEGGQPIHPLLFSTLYPSAPLLQLNVANGDYAVMEKRNCGCALGEAGFLLHLHDLRSYEKFTGEGMNYFYGDLFEFLEKTLPSEFSGAPGDYQLAEEEDDHGQTRLTLVVHPEVGAVDEERLLARLTQRFASGSRDNRFMSNLWQHAGTFRIKRGVPYASSRGKILPLHSSVRKSQL